MTCVNGSLLHMKIYRRIIIYIKKSLTLQLLGYFATRHLLGGGRGVKRPQSITREPIAAATRARRQTKARDKTLPMICSNLNFDVRGQVSVRPHV